MQNEIKTSEDIENILQALCCKEMIDILGSSHINKQQLLAALINSRMGFDAVMPNEPAQDFIKDIAEPVCYQDENYQSLVMAVCTMGSSQQDPKSGELLHDLYNFHFTLSKVASVAIKLLKANEATTAENNNLSKVISITRGKDEIYGYTNKVSSF